MTSPQRVPTALDQRRKRTDWAVWRRRLDSTRRTSLKVLFTLRRGRSYALTVAGLACLVVAASTVATGLAWLTAALSLLAYNWGLENGE
jgi:hypothetical protein